MKFDFIENLSGLIVAKDCNSTFFNISKSFAKLIGFNSSEECRGINDYHLRCKAVEYADGFVKMDKLALSSPTKMISLDVQNYTSGWKAILVERNSIKNAADKVTGLLGQCIDVTETDIFKSFIRLAQMDHKIRGKTLKPASYILSNTHSPLPLTDRQEHILFLLIRGNSLSTISAKLNISKRTVESHLDAIKHKLNCQYKSEVIEKAIDSGFLCYIPKEVQGFNFL